MSATNKIFNVVLIGAFGLVGLGLSLFLVLGSDRAVSAVYETGMEKLAAGDLESARLAFLRALERSEDKAPPAFQLARLAAREDPAAALPFLRVALEEGRPDGRMLAGMASLSLAAGEVGLSRQLIDRLQTVDPANSELLPLRGRLAIAQRRFAEAVGLFEELLSSGSASNEVKFTLGQLLSRSQRELDRTRAKVILMEAARGDDPASQNALLFIVASGLVEMDGRDWAELFQVGMEKGFLNWAPVRENLPLLRRLTQIAVVHAPSFTPDIAEKRVVHPEAETPDFVDAAMMAQRARNLRRAGQLLDTVPEADQESFGVRLLRAHQLILEGRPDAGMIELEKVIAESPGERAAVPLLRDLADAPEGMLSVREQGSVLELLAGHPDATLNDRFMAYGRLLELRPLRARDIMREVSGRLGPHAPRQVAKWFLDLNEPGFVEELVTAEMARSDGSLFEMRLLALLRQGKIEAAEDFLRDRPAGLPSILLSTGRLRLEMARDNLEAARATWREVMAAADLQGLLSYFPLLANMAMEFGSRDLALEAYQLGFERGATMAEADWLRFTTLVAEEGTLAAQRAIAEAALRAHPENPYFINNAAYLQLLVGDNVRENLVRMEQVVDGNPSVDAFRVTLSLAYLRNNRATMALRTLDRIEVDWTPDGASAQVIYLASLADGNRRSLAENLARNVDTTRLLPEELELIAPLLRR
jgi:hypothetical protein